MHHPDWCLCAPMEDARKKRSTLKAGNEQVSIRQSTFFFSWSYTTTVMCVFSTNFLNRPRLPHNKIFITCQQEFILWGCRLSAAKICIDIGLYQEHSCLYSWVPLIQAAELFRANPLISHITGDGWNLRFTLDIPISAYFWHCYAGLLTNTSSHQFFQIGIVHVNPESQTTSVAWNLGLTLDIPVAAFAAFLKSISSGLLRIRQVNFMSYVDS